MAEVNPAPRLQERRKPVAVDDECFDDDDGRRDDLEQITVSTVQPDLSSFLYCQHGDSSIFVTSTAGPSVMAPNSKAVEPSPVATPPSTAETDLIRSLPGPVIRVLVLFARPIRLLRVTTEVLLWKTGRRVESWMVVGGWWCLCLGAAHGFKYLLPIAIFLPLLPLDVLLLPHIGKLPGLRNKPLPPSTQAEPSTHDSLLMTLSDLHSVHALIPTIHSSRVVEAYDRFRHLGPARLSRGLVVIWSAWLILGRIVGYRALLALLGTVILLLPSPPFAQLIDLMSRSLLVRRSLALLFLFAFGSPPEQSIKFDLHFSLKDWLRGKWAASRRPSLAFAIRPKMAPGKADEQALDDEEEEQAGDPIYFKFEVHENQRWWMGLDWTSALVPQERPSWCDSHLLPASPPGAFSLPSSTSIVLPAPTPSDPDAKVKRTATWKWLDDDWSIVRAGAGARAASTNPLSASAPGTTGPSPNPADDADSIPGSVGGGRISSPAKARPSSGIFGTSPSDETTLTSPTGGTGTRTQSIAEQAFTKGLERLKRSAAPVVAAASSPRSSGEFTRPGAGGASDRRTSQASDDLAALDGRIAASAATGAASGSAATVALMGGGEMIVEKDDATDVDGWVYGDNKWESMGPKGGLGKFTRRRRWTRRAMCIETIQRIPSIVETPAASTPSSDGSASNGTAAGYKLSTPQRPSLSRNNSSHSPVITPKANSKSPLPAVQTDTSAMAFSNTSSAEHSVSPTRGRSAVVAALVEGRDRSVSSDSGSGSITNGGAGVLGNVTVMPQARGEHSRDDVLRQRLKKAMGSVGG